MLELLYNLKERLEFAILGSVSLMGQDFKLKGALDDFEKVASSSKVLEKIHATAKKLIEGKPSAQEVLDLIALIDAVLMTQIPTTSGNEIEAPEVLTRQYIRIPSKSLKAFNDSVYSTGSGRVEVLSTLLADGILVNDFRIFQGMIYALKDRYSEVKSLMIEKLSLCDESVVEYLKSLGSSDGLDEMTLLYIISKITKGAEDEYLKKLYEDRINTKKITKKAKEEMEDLVSIITPNVENLEFFKKVYKDGSYERLVTLKLMQMSINDGKNYINDITDEILEYLPRKKNNNNKDTLAVLFSNDSRFTDVLVDDFNLKLSKKLTDEVQTQSLNNQMYTMLYSCANKPNEKWFSTILECLKDEKLFTPIKKNKEYYTKESSKFALVNIIAEYVFINRDNLDQKFLDEAYNILGEDKAPIEFIIDIQNKPADYIFDTYSKYFGEKISYIASNILYTLLFRMIFDGENYELISPLYNSIKTNVQRYSGYRFNDFDNKIEYVKIFEPLDTRWYKVLVENSYKVCEKICLPNTYIETFVTEEDTNWNIDIDYCFNRNNDYYDRILRRLDSKNADTLKSIAESIFNLVDKHSRYRRVHYFDIYNVISEEIDKIEEQRAEKKEKK